MRPCTFLIIAALVLLLSPTSIATADEVHGAALLLVNRDYEGVPGPVPSPDVPGMTSALRRRGFATTVRENVGGDELTLTIDQFVKTVPTNGVGLLYLAGYVLPAEVDGEVDEVLLPVDFKPVDTVRRGRGVRGLLELIRNESGAAFTLVVIDGSAPRAPGAESSEDSPARPTVDDNVLLCYAGPGFAPSFAARLADPKVTLTESARGAAGETNGWMSPSNGADVPALRPVSRPPAEIEAGHDAGEEWVNHFGTVFCWCPPGKLPKVANREGARIEQGFWIGKYEVTRREFDLVTPMRPQGAVAVRPNHPRDGIRYNDMMQFVEQLNWRGRFFKRLPEEWEYALPTETEWEYACRAGTGSSRYFGEDAGLLPAHANFADRRLFDTKKEYYLYADRSADDGATHLAEVGSYKPNPWGLHDIYGNLWEWTATVETVGDRRYPVARGGSWVSLPEYCRSDFRHRFDSATERNFIGFRLVLRRTGD